MALITYRKGTAITTTLLLRPIILLLTAYVLVVALRPAVRQKLPRMLVRVPIIIVSTEVSFRSSPAGSWNHLATGNKIIANPVLTGAMYFVSISCYFNES